MVRLSLTRQSNNQDLQSTERTLPIPPLHVWRGREFSPAPDKLFLMEAVGTHLWGFYHVLIVLVVSGTFVARLSVSWEPELRRVLPV